MDGIINLNKPAGITSFDAIRRLKRITGERKMGHLGTLDPMATGVLPIFLGKMTKLIPYFNLGDKGYQAEVTLGASSNTLDKEGDLTPAPVPPLSAEQIQAALAGFVGEITQIPPMYSAIRVQGKRLYELARAGQEIDRTPRQVTIYKIENLEIDLPRIRFSLLCSKGTYIRSLAADLGVRLGTQAYLSGLTRYLVGERFRLQESISLDQIEKFSHSSALLGLMDPLSLFGDWNHLVTLGPEEERAVTHGNKIPVAPNRSLDFAPNQAQCLVSNEAGRLLAAGLLEFSQEGPLYFQPEKVLV